MSGESRPPVDLTLALAALMLLASGLVLIYSTSGILALGRYGDSYHFIKRQLLFAGLGLAALALTLRLRPAGLRQAAGPLMAASLVLLVLVLIPGLGRSAGGARRWLGFGPLRFQPSELAKAALVLFAADRLAREGRGLNWRGGMPAVMLATGLAAGLCLLEPDFGSAAMIVLLGAGMMYAGGMDVRRLLMPALALAAAAAFLILRSPYRLRRVTAFLDPWQDPSGAGFQIVHSMMAFGSGGLLGRGLGEGRQKLYYLPEPHTDFIFSTAGEEFGLLGCLTLLFLFALLLFRGLMTALKGRGPFERLAALGLTLALGLKVAVNLFVVLGLAPTKGSTLPFLSSGGSSLVVDLAAVGLLLNLSRHGRTHEASAPGARGAPLLS